jgi:D-alanine-D-alanine ligase
MSTLRKVGHQPQIIGVRNELGVIRSAIDEFKPDIVFNLLEEFHDQVLYDQNVVSYLELIPIAYTGCNPRGMILSRDKALARKILSYHRIPGPAFTVCKRGRKVKRPASLQFPLIVKSQVEEASLGISQASIVDNDVDFAERVGFMHERCRTDVIVEEYIDGRELYVGLIGEERVSVLPVWELNFANMPENQARIATRKAKWDPRYQEKHGIKSGPADIRPELAQRIATIAKRTYKALGLSGYARLDLRLNAAGEPFVIEANPNPEVAKGEDFASAAAHAGIQYEDLIQKILSLGLRHNAG